MVDSFTVQNDLVEVIDNDDIVFKAEDIRRTVQYWPSEKLTGTKSVAFHSPPQDTAYWWAGGATGEALLTMRSVRRIRPSYLRNAAHREFQMSRWILHFRTY